MDNPFFSLIVPIYNVESYIEECLNSILQQTYGDFELLCVDDEGKDCSMQIVSELASSDARIQILHHPHGGLPSTRNVGLEHAKGKYIILVDGDDKLEAHHLERMKKILEEDFPEMCVSNTYTRYWNDHLEYVMLFPLKNIKDKIAENAYPLEDQIKAMTNLDYAFPASAWLTVYARSFLEKNDLKYNEQLVCSEDTDFFLQALSVVKKLKFSNYEFYFYRQDNSSAMTKNMTADMFCARIQIDKKWYNYFREDYQNDFIRKRICAVIQKDLRGNVQYILKSFPNLMNDTSLLRILKESLYIWGTFEKLGFKINLICIKAQLVFAKIKSKYYIFGKAMKKKFGGIKNAQRD